MIDFLSKCFVTTKSLHIKSNMFGNKVEELRNQFYSIHAERFATTKISLPLERFEESYPLYSYHFSNTDEANKDQKAKNLLMGKEPSKRFKKRFNKK